MKITTESVTLLRVLDKKFKGNDGAEIEYKNATLLDDEGNKFEMAVHKDALFDMTLEKVQGVASIESVIAANKGGGSRIKFKLLDFSPARK